MKLSKGLYTDTAPQDQPQGSYRFAKNILLTNTRLGIENEPGFTSLGTLAPYTVIGMFTIEEDILVFSTNNTNSEIGIISNGVYSAVYNAADMNLNTANPIQAEYYRDYKSERIVAWIDGLNPPRIINIDDPSLVSVTEDLLLFPEFELPDTDLTVNDSGGSLLSGTYYFSYRYKFSDDSSGNWTSPFGPVYTTNSTTSGGFNEYTGVAGGSPTSKSIGIDLTNLDTRFTTIEIAAVSIVEGVTTAKIIKELPIPSSGSASTIYAGTENLNTISVDEILVDTNNYINAKAITSLNDRLYLGNVESEEFNFQANANDIVINYTTEAVDPDSLVSTNSKLGDTRKGFQHGEVYAFYIVFHYKNGSLSRAFHIPGREAIAGETDPSTTYNGIAGLADAKVFHVEDTANSDPTASSNMGYWENEGELYPTGFPDLAGDPVRHHRFPTVREMRTESGDADYGKSVMYRLGINVSNVSVAGMPSNFVDRISGYQIFYARRDYANSQVVGQGIFQYGAVHEDFGSSPPAGSDNYMSSGANFGLDDVGGGTGNGMNVNDDTVRCTWFSLASQRPSISPTYISQQVQLTISTLGALGTSPISPATSGVQDINTPSAEYQRLAWLDYYEDATAANVVDADFIKGVNTGQYVPANTVDGQWNNVLGEGSYVANIDSAASLVINTNALNTSNRQDNTPTEDTYLSTLNQFIVQPYSGFANQQLVATDTIQNGVSPFATGITNVYGGDTYTGLVSITTHSPSDANDIVHTGTVPYGRVVVKHYLTEQRDNHTLRHEVAGDSQSLFYPDSGATDLSDIFDVYDTRLDNTYGYNTDYSAVNDLNGVTGYNPLIDTTTTFPHTVVYSDVQSTEGVGIAWRSFPVDNQHTMPRNRGVITNLQGINNEDLIIHHENSLFKTKTNRSLQTETDQEVVLGSTGLFAFPPMEILSSQHGYAGTQHALSCRLTKTGYSFVDDQNGKVFLYTNKGLEEISLFGNRKFFRDFMREDLADNPYTSTGYTTEYDETYDRLIVTKKNGSSSWTASYSPEMKVWISYHDYIPDFIVSTVNSNLYSVKGDTFYQHHTGAYGTFYDTVYPMIIDSVFNPEPQQSKTISSIDWVTEVYQDTGEFVEDDTFNYITVFGSNTCSNRIELEKAVNISTYYNTRQAERTWSFNRFRNVAIPTAKIRDTFYNNYAVLPAAINSNLDWYNKERFIDKYIIARLEYDNSTGDKITLLELSFAFRRSYR